MAATAPSVTGAYVGTSGFSYRSWRPAFYPAGTRERDFLGSYSARLSAVEINSSFYGLPSEERVRRWAAETPADFRFAVKLAGRITHGGAVGLAATFCERLGLLGDKLGPVLVQLPARRPRDEGFLQLLLDSLDPRLTYAFELRDPSWNDVDEQLAAAGVARVNALGAAAPLRYLRLREPPYEQAALAQLAERLRPDLAAGVPVYCFFKHEDEPTAALYAHRLLELLSAPASRGATRSPRGRTRPAGRHGGRT